MELHLSWKKVYFIFSPPFLMWMDLFLYYHRIQSKANVVLLLWWYISIISQVGVIDYAFTFSSTFSTHQNKHRASDWFIDWDQVKISELSRRKAVGFRSVRQQNQIICFNIGPASPVAFSHHLLPCRGDQCQRSHQFWKRSFQWQWWQIASSFESFSCSLLQRKCVHTTLISGL